MANLETDFLPFPSYQDNLDEGSLEDGRPVRYHYASERSNSRWNHIVDLDTFFSRIYQYHQKHGLACMMLQEFLELLQFVFTVLFGIYLYSCVDYPVLFGDKMVHNSTSKITFADACLPLGSCFFKYNFTILCFTIACVIFLWKSARIFYNFYLYLDIKDFYLIALGIKEKEIDNFTWHEVQQRLQAIQREQQMCIHKQDLTELDIYHRILRFTNYLVAMVNKNIIPTKLYLPLIGEFAFLSKGLKWNYAQLLFCGYDAPFSQWSLKDEYKLYENKTDLARRLANRCRWYGFANLIFCPIIFIWQVLYSFLSYGEMIKRQPSFFGTRSWSQYGKLYVRHFNELDHELNSRLNRGYKHATKYMGSFSSPKSVIVSKKVIYFCASICSVLIFATVYDESLLHVDHVLTVITVLGSICVAAQTFLPDENLVVCPENQFKAVLGEINYIPSHWNGKTHTMKVRNEFGQLFQYKFNHLLTEMLSPLICPFILIFMLPKYTEKIIDFFRNFTVSVVGVGDVCSFAQMDIRKNGNPLWMSPGQEQNVGLQAQEGKTELSLMHFVQTNPEWKPPELTDTFLSSMRYRSYRHACDLQGVHEENPFYYSLYSTSTTQAEYNSIIGSLMRSKMTQSVYPSVFKSSQTEKKCKNLTSVEGPMNGSSSGLLTSIQSSGALHDSLTGKDIVNLLPALTCTPCSDEQLREVNMSFTTLYMHQLHQMRLAELEETGQLSHQEPSHEAARILGHSVREIQNIQEEEHNENTPLVDFTVENFRYT